MSRKKEHSADIRVVKRGKKHAAHHGGAWKVAYADFVTAMMAFFLVMWIMGLNQEAKAAVEGYFKDPKEFMAEVEAKKDALKRAGFEERSEADTSQLDAQSQEIARLKAAKQTIENIVAAAPEFKELKEYVDVKLVDDGMKIDLMEAKESLFFDAASARVKPEARELLSRIAAELRKLPNKVIVEGHTDIRPLARRDNYTNWELSADRANSARRVMQAAGVSEKQIAQIRGYAATQPREPRDPTHFSNRRVSIVVMLQYGVKRQQPSGGDEGKAEGEGAAAKSQSAHPTSESATRKHRTPESKS